MGVVPRGTTPIACWRATTASRHCSQPASKVGKLYRWLRQIGPLLGNVMRRVHRSGSEIEEERAARARLLLVLHEANRMIGEILGQVVSLERCQGR